MVQHSQVSVKVDVNMHECVYLLLRDVARKPCSLTEVKILDYLNNFT